MVLTAKYECLSPDERVTLWLAANARGDEAECSRLLASAGKSTVRMLNRAVWDRIDRLTDAGLAARTALSAPIERFGLVEQLLAPTPLWSDGIDEAEFPRPGVAARLIGLAVEKAFMDHLIRGSHLDDDAFDRALNAGRAISGSAQNAVEAMLSTVLVGSYIRARSLLAGVAQWCEMIAVNPDDFFAYSFGDLIDHLDTLRPVAHRARERLKARHRELTPSMSEAEYLIDDLDHVDQESADALAGMLCEYLPSLERT